MHPNTGEIRKILPGFYRDASGMGAVQPISSPEP